jgi:hypothetical protein
MTWCNIGHMTPRLSEGGGGKRGCGIYRSRSGMYANQTENHLLPRGRGMYKIYTKVLEGTTNRSRFVRDWRSSRQQESKYLDMVTWGRNMSNGKSVSFSSKQCLRGLEKIWLMEISFSDCIYAILKDRRRPMEETPSLNHIKTRLPDYIANRFST